MTNPDQLRLYDTPRPECIFRDYIDDEDRHCSDHGMGPSGYEVLDEDSPNLDAWLADVRWVDISDVHAKDISIPQMPSYIPTIGHNSARLFEKYQPPMVAVRLADVISPEKLKVIDSIEKRFGTPKGMPVVLQGSGKDRLLENIWPKRHIVLPQLARLGFVAATAFNYSVWADQPHAERLINIKRALLIYEEMQQLGMPTIPHMYWCGRVSLDAWLKWLNENPAVSVLAINMQTLRSDYDWSRALADLSYFVAGLKRPIHFLITGPYTPIRVAQIRLILPSMTLSNGTPSRMAFASQRMYSTGLRVLHEYSAEHKSLLLRNNTGLYTKMFQRRLIRNGAQRVDFADKFDNYRKHRVKNRQDSILWQQK